MSEVDNVIKVLAIKEILTTNNFKGKIVEFQEYYTNGSLKRNGEIGIRILWDKKTNLLIRNLETQQTNIENWKGDPLYDDITIGDLVEGKIINFATEYKSTFKCALFSNDVNELKKATQQYFYMSGKNILTDKDGAKFTYYSPIKIIFTS